jgi:hypothetical protein
MKVTKENLQASKIGDLGYLVTKSHMPHGRNNIDNVTKVNDDEYHVKCYHDQGPTVFSLDEFVRAYNGKTIHS